MANPFVNAQRTFTRQRKARTRLKETERMTLEERLAKNKEDEITFFRERLEKRRGRERGLKENSTVLGSSGGQKTVLGA